jgi:hypothetical protein
MTSSTSLTNSQLIIEYTKSTHKSCLYLSVAALMILLFICSPLNAFFITSLFGKAFILILLGYLIYYNLTQTNIFSNNFDVSLISGYWNPVKSNILCSYVFSVVIIILMISVFRS